MLKVRLFAFTVCLLTLLSFVRVGYSMDYVVVEFLYYEPDCIPCYAEQYEVYEHNSQVIENIQDAYGSKVQLERIFIYSDTGIDKVKDYGMGGEDCGGWHCVGEEDWNAIVVNYERVFSGYVNETYIEEIVDAYLTDSVHDVSVTKVRVSNTTVELGQKIDVVVTVNNFGIVNESFNVNLYSNDTLIGRQSVSDLSPSQEFSMIFNWNTTDYSLGKYFLKAEAEPVANETKLMNNFYIHNKIWVKNPYSGNFIAMFMLAFTFGFFETFSPCLIVLLSFVMSYTIGETSHFREGFQRVMAFGIGFICATLLLALALGFLFLSTPRLQSFLTWLVCLFAVILGLELLGVLRISSITKLQSKPLIKKLARKYVITYAGLFLLGFIFYFLDPCIAPIFVSMIPLLVPETLFLTLFVFCIGAIIPFFGFGVFAGSISNLVRSTYRQRFKIRAISGLILISYAIYLIVFQLIPRIN